MDIKVGKKTLEEVTDIIRNLLAEPELYTEQEKYEITRLEERCSRGCRKSIESLCNYIAGLLVKYGIHVEEKSPEEVAREIYRYTWGLGPVEDIYNDPEVDDVEIIGTDTVFTIRRGKYCCENIKFKDLQELYSLIKRQFDMGDLTTASPRLRTVREDGTRVYATAPPFTGEYTLTFRKHKTFVYSKKNLKKAGTIEDRTYDYLKIFNKGLLNIIYVGATTTGKTSMLRYFYRYSDPDIRTMVFEPRFELRLRENYPGRNIVEFQEVPGAGITLLEAFDSALQMTATRMIVGEILGKETPEAIKASLRGHTGNLTTFHAVSIIEALMGLAMCLIEEGRSQQIYEDLAIRRVVKAFDLVVHIFSPPNSGIKKVVSISEPGYEDGKIVLNELVKWQADEDNYMSGEWIYPSSLSSSTKEKLFQNGISWQEMREAGLV